MSNFLELNFSGGTLASVEGGSGPLEWTGGNDYYTVKINVTDAKYDYFHIIIADGTNKQVIEVATAVLQGLSYFGNFRVPRVLGDNTKINLGVITKDTTAENVIVSSPLSVIVRNGIAQPVPFTLEGEEVSNSGFVSLLNLLEDGKVLEDITLVDHTVNGNYGQYLKVEYKTKGQSQAKYLGPVTQDLIQLGAQIKRNDSESKGGGGKLGYGSNLIYSQLGFAGGYQAVAGSGAALGANASAATGVAIGLAAEASYTSGGIAIGKNTKVKGGSKSVATLAIGDYSQAQDSPRSIVMGVASEASNPDEQRVALVSNSERTIGIGYNIKVNNMDDGVAIGTNVFARGWGAHKDNDKYLQDGIIIGREASGILSGAIAIGPLARVAFQEDKLDTINANITDEKKGYGLKNSKRAFGGIAIGTEAYTRRGGGISLGRYAKAYGSNSIAIGSQSVSGIKEKNYSNWSDEKDSKDSSIFAIAIGGDSASTGRRAIALGCNTSSTGLSSIAIGTSAIAKADGAVQIGKGTNTKENSLKFRDITIINEHGKLNPELLKDVSITTTTASTAKVTHPLKKIEAKENAEIAFKDVSNAAKNKKGVTKTVKFDSAFSKKPNVVCSFRSDSSALYDLGLSVISISKESFTYKITANPNYKSSSSAKIGVQWIAVAI